MKTTIMQVTPEMAGMWLDEGNKKRNRPLSSTTVEQIARQIRNGEWQLTHQGIAFDEDGNLLDGQHRLKAIQVTGVTLPMMVIQGVPKSTFTVLDTGRKRTGKDALHLSGEVNTLHLASALRGLHLYQVDPDTEWSGVKSMVTNDQLIDILNQNPGMRDALGYGTAIQRAIHMTITAAAIGWYVTSAARPEIDQESWLEGVTTGANLRHGDPRLTLRNTMISLNAGTIVRRRQNSRTHLHYYIKAWNAWAEGREQKILRRSSGEKMPRPTTRGSAPEGSVNAPPISGI